MKQLLIFLCSSFISFTGFTQNAELSPLIGNWKGNLTYIDYRSGKPVHLKTEMAITPYKANKNGVVIFYQYPEEPKANSYDTLQVSADAKMINDKPIISRSNDEWGNLVIVSEKKGMDNYKPAILRYIYTIGKNDFIIRKEVKLEDATEYMLRNEYRLTPGNRN